MMRRMMTSCVSQIQQQTNTSMRRRMMNNGRLLGLVQQRRFTTFSSHLPAQSAASVKVVELPTRKTMKHATTYSEDFQAAQHPWLFTAYNIARSVNIDRNSNAQLNGLLNQYSCTLVEDTKLSLVVQVSGSKPQTAGSPTLGMVDLGETNGSFIILYHFGSICFLNCDETLQQQWVQTLQVDNSFVVTKDFIPIAVDSSASDWCKMGRDHAIVQKLDVNNMNIISGVLARSVALKSYEISSNITLENFRKLNEEIERTGKIHKRDEKVLIPVFAHANGLKCDLLLSVRLLERPDVTWLWHRYDQLYDLLQDEFEIEDRFTHLEKGLDFIQQNNMFYMELQHSKKSERAEWLIIILIATEICIALIHHSLESIRDKEHAKSK
jgi:uncharacterized Rmd1/YagE family protein